MPMLATSFSRRLALGAIASLAVTVAQAQSPVFVPGTGVGMVPPKGMTLARSFAGYEDPPNAASVLVAEFPVEAYAQILPTFTPEGLKPGGLDISGPATDWPVAGGQGGRFVRGTQTLGGSTFRKWLLLAKGPARTVMISLQVPEPRAAAYPDAAVEAALKTVTLRAPPTVSDQLASLPYRVGDMAGFRPVRVLAGSALLLTDGPQDTIPDASQPVVVVASGLDATTKGDAAARAAFSKQAFASVPGVSDVLIEEEKGYEADGAAWYRIEAKGTYREAGEAVWLLQLVRFTPTGYIRTLGITRTLDKLRFQARIERIAASTGPR